MFIIMGYRTAGAFFDCSKFAAVEKNSNKKKGRKKNRKGVKRNE